RLAALHALRNDVLVAHVRFVSLDRMTSAAKWREANCLHGFANAMTDEPAGLERAAARARKLVGADPLLRRRKQEHRLQPKPHRHVRGLEHGADLHGKGLAALVALVRADAGALAAHLGDAIHAAAMRADWAFRPHTGLYPVVGGLLVLKVL